MNITTRYAQAIPDAPPAVAGVIGKDGLPGAEGNVGPVGAAGAAGTPGAGGLFTASPGVGATLNLDFSGVNNNFRITLPAGNVILTRTAGPNGYKCQVSLIQPAAGGGTVTWFAGIHWSNGAVVPVLTATGNKIDHFGFEEWATFPVGFTIGKNTSLT